jgi:hypothetical protein
MADTQEKLEELLGDGWLVTSVHVAASNWRKGSFRREFLCQKAKQGHYHVEDEPAGERRKVFFGVEDV